MDVDRIRGSNQVFGRQVFLGQMANRVDQNVLLPDLENRPMRRLPAETVQQLTNWKRKCGALSRQAVLVRILFE